MQAAEAGGVRSGTGIGAESVSTEKQGVARAAGNTHAAVYNPGIHKYSIFVVCWTVLLLTMGALVTSKDAALSVADWPTSFGRWFPPLRMLTGGALYEHSHRVIAAVLGMFIVVLAGLLWKYDSRRWLKVLGFAALGGVIVQGILGGLTVIELLHYWLPVMHAVTAELMFAVLVSIAFFTSRWWTEDLATAQDRGTPSIHLIAILNAAVIFLQALAGAGYRHQYISVNIHVIGSMVVLGMVIWTALVLKRRFSDVKELVRARVALHGIVGVQILLGIAALWSRIATTGDPQPEAVMVAFTAVHTVVGALLFATAIVAVLLSYRLVPRRERVLAGSRENPPGEATA